MSVFLTIVVTLAGVIILFVRWRVTWRKQFKEVADDVEERPDVADFIHSSDSDVGDAEMPPYLYDLQSTWYDQLDAGLKDLDTKASSILGFLGGGIGLYAVISGGKMVDAPRPSWMLFIAIAALFGSVLAAIACLRWRRRRGIPKLNQWSDPSVAGHTEATKAKLALYAALVYSDRNYVVRRINIRKAYFLELSQWLFAFGALILLVNFAAIALNAGGGEKGTVVHCRGASSVPHAGSVALDCTLQKGP